jgi:Uma2 family endonuclease
MSATTLPPASAPLVSADEFLRLHGDESGIELINGVITRLPMPGTDHGIVCGNAYHYIREVVKAGNLGRVMTNDTFVRTRTNPDGYRGADVAYISHDILPATVPHPKGPLVPPLELVVEVRSPSDSYGEVATKAYEYLDAGVRVVMVIDPETNSVGVFRPNELPVRFHNGDVVVLPDVLPGFAVPVGKFFE